jgi:hypothetical protein
MARIALVAGGMGGLGTPLCVRPGSSDYQGTTAHCPGNAWVGIRAGHVSGANTPSTVDNR